MEISLGSSTLEVVNLDPLGCSRLLDSIQILNLNYFLSFYDHFDHICALDLPVRSVQD